MGSNARILENRYSSLKNSPSGKFLIHPNSRIPDTHPADLVEMKQKLNDLANVKYPMINPSYSLTNII